MWCLIFVLYLIHNYKSFRTFIRIRIKIMMTHISTVGCLCFYSKVIDLSSKIGLIWIITSFPCDMRATPINTKSLLVLINSSFIWHDEKQNWNDIINIKQKICNITFFVFKYQQFSIAHIMGYNKHKIILQPCRTCFDNENLSRVAIHPDKQGKFYYL